MCMMVVYGLGKFGVVDCEIYVECVELYVLFQVEFLMVYFICWFVWDLVEYMVYVKGGNVVVFLDNIIV